MERPVIQSLATLGRVVAQVMEATADEEVDQEMLSLVIVDKLAAEFGNVHDATQAIDDLSNALNKALTKAVGS